MNDSIKTAHVLVIKDNKVLLVSHGEKADHLTGVYGIPGGRLQEGEQLMDAAVRELIEETGLDTAKENLISYPDNEYTADIQRKSGKIQKFTMTVFIADSTDGTIHDTEENSPEWIEIQHLDTYNLLPNVRLAIDKALLFLNKEKG